MTNLNDENTVSPEIRTMVTKNFKKLLMTDHLPDSVDIFSKEYLEYATMLKETYPELWRELYDHKEIPKLCNIHFRLTDTAIRQAFAEVLGELPELLTDWRIPNPTDKQRQKWYRIGYNECRGLVTALLKRRMES